MTESNLSQIPDGVAPGKVIANKYRVDGVIGRGGMGVVVKATHLELREPVAIKVLLTDFSQPFLNRYFWHRFRALFEASSSACR